MKIFLLYFALLSNQMNAQALKGGPEVQDAQFAGGQEKLSQYFAQHLRYPEKAAIRHIEGTVTVTFTIGSDGAVSKAKIRGGLGGDCDKEALRLVASMPKWQPATLNGKPIACGKTVRVEFRMPL